MYHIRLTSVVGLAGKALGLRQSSWSPPRAQEEAPGDDLLRTDL